MIYRSNKYPNYIVKKFGPGIALFREGANSPLKPVKGNKKNATFALWHNGRRVYVSLFDFIFSCADDFKLKL